jgi:hypothetical protein
MIFLYRPKIKKRIHLQNFCDDSFLLAVFLNLFADALFCCNFFLEQLVEVADFICLALVLLERDSLEFLVKLDSFLLQLAYLADQLFLSDFVGAGIWIELNCY